MNIEPDSISTPVRPLEYCFPSGDPREVRATIDRWCVDHGPALYGYCRRLLGDDAEAEDAMQTVFVQVLRDFHTFRRNGSPRTLLLSIARNRCFDRLRRRVAFPSVDEQDADLALVSERPGPDQVFQRGEEVKAMEYCLDRLPALTRAVLMLRFHEECSFREIAARTGLAEGAARARVMRALPVLKSELERLGFKVDL